MSEQKKVKKILRVSREDYSNLSAFVERPVPTEKEVESFERVVDREARNQEIDTNLSEIYTDKKGGLVDVKKMKIKHRQLSIVRFFKSILILTLLAGAAYFAYTYFFDKSNDVNSLEMEIVAPEKVLAGEEFTYQINYHNPTKFVLTGVHLEVQYPENFIASSSSITPNSGDFSWNLPNLEPGANGTLSVTGKLINKPDSVNVISSRLSYQALNYSSQFKKEASASTIVSGSGWQTDLSYGSTAFLNQDNEMTLSFSDIQNNYLGDFNLTFSLPAETNASVASSSDSGTASTSAAVKTITISKSGGTVQISGLDKELGRQEIPLSYKIKTRVDKPEIIVRLEKKLENGRSYIFWEKSIQPDLVSSDLNLTMSVNDSKADGAANFGQTLNYSISYNNQGSHSFKDVVIMAVLKSDFLDTNSLRMGKKGNLNGQTITWTENEIPALAEIKPGQSGEINFSINLAAFDNNDLGKDLSVNSYAQYGVNNQAVKNSENKSNVIVSRINSDLSLSERILYFNDDNTPVGSGPLPPKVGEKSGFKVYWTVKNNLHELSDTRVIFTLPANVSFDGKNSANVGSISYDDNTRQVTWEIGRLPVSVYQINAEFGISVTPLASDQNKILVLSSGSTVSATDTETKATIEKKTEAKTTKLEDDDIAKLSNSGRVQ